MILPSCRRHPLSVCNSDKNGDLAPTNTLDLQAPQISYLANETIMGRPRTHFQVVSQATSKRQ